MEMDVDPGTGIGMGMGKDIAKDRDMGENYDNESTLSVYLEDIKSMKRLSAFKIKFQNYHPTALLLM
jgi:hypothetical protein